MGILFFIYSNLVAVVNCFSKKKLYILGENNGLQVLNIAAVRYNYFFNFEHDSTQKFNFFKKKNGLFVVFSGNLLVKCFFEGRKGVSVEKKKFFFFNMLFLFFNDNYFKKWHEFSLVETATLNSWYIVCVQLAVVALNFSSNKKITFINFNKFFDFFFFKRMIFKSHRALIKVAINLVNFIKNPALEYSYALKSRLLSTKVLKYNSLGNNNFEGNDIIQSAASSKYLFLINSFFSKKKKFFFLRNNEIYNKSRYSRNRQTYRTGVFWCIWLTVLTVIGLYFYFYIFLIKFTYVWILFYWFILSFSLFYFRSKIEKHFFF